MRFMEADIIGARAWTAVAGGDVVGARELLEDSYVLAVETKNLVAAFTAAHDLVRLGQPEYADTCRELADRIEGPRAHARTAHAVALAARDAHSLLAASHDLAAMPAASGLSNKDIAARLSLSVRTVENKLHSVHEQLGVNGRSDLGDALDVGATGS